MKDANPQAWAQEEFGGADIGDARRTVRLVDVATGAAARPAGRITEVYGHGADRTAAFRLLGNGDVDTEAIARSSHRACAGRCAREDFAYVPVDGSSLNLTDRRHSKDLGIVGARNKGARGLLVMTAIAVTPDGTPQGLCGQVWWTRKGRVRVKDQKKDRRRLESKETMHWLEVMQQVREAFAAVAPETKPWFQLDRGGDAWPVLLDGLHPGQLFTVRASADRRLRRVDDEPRRYLWDQVERQALLGQYELEITPRAGRAGRMASMEVRSCEVCLDLQDKRSKRRFEAPLWAVLAREVGTQPPETDPIEWLLLTTKPVGTAAEAEQVVRGYAQRWRIEEFHRLWKTGACNVEDTQLRDSQSIIRWATILASVAMRLLRLTYLARNQPTVPATAELSGAEIEAIIAERKPLRVHLGQVPAIGVAVGWLAEIGGYTGKSSGGPPGALVIQRGLDRIRALADYLADHRKM